jgi:thiol-disulfide isomerase/thioredoxin
MNRALVLAVSLAMASPLLGQEVKSEGRGSHREKMDAAQGTAFDAAMWKSLNSWMGSAPLTADATKGKVVCIVTWASWNNASARALQEAQKASAAYGDKGLMVIGVHDRNGWDQAAQVMGSNKVTFVVAHDEKGEFIKKLGGDNHPDVFVVDRAGNIRYADIMTDSIDTAVKQLTAETPEQAASAGSSAAKPEETAAAPKKGGKYTAPAAAAYAAAKWPPKNSGNLSAKDLQGKPLPGGGLGQEKYLTAKPDREGKVTVIDFWATWCGPCVAAMPELDKLQKEHKNDVVVLGLSSEAEAKVSSFLKSKKHEYSQAIDQNGRLNNAMGVQGIPHVVVLSSDGVIRWQGHPMDPGFKGSIKTLLEVDPGIKARREAEKKG